MVVVVPWVSVESVVCVCVWNRDVCSVEVERSGDVFLLGTRREYIPPFPPRCFLCFIALSLLV